ncbi:LysR family transcriptional regulator [Natronospira bacteriovora]|uniref:LysR family transcriptional regulator n=1 Tax=Natronospira bacteriovora TaxID=3069753 RepID=A0ABU0WAM9_9GAMM|nr:LysR family transcriptional regulator [Natronospira sp. AB-CW4]MDQ2070828.1 LysR family transcriptional regulator [Natronospira sp. AB-CW4]
MHLTLHQLRIFRTVAETGSITRAAKQLHLTPPTLSIQLRQLSEAAGLPLYEVVGRRLRLTEAGHDMFEAARAVDEPLRRLEQQLSARQGIERGRLKIAAVSTGEYFMPRVLGNFRRQHPGIEASLSILPRSALIERLNEGLDDWYLMTRPPSDRRLENQQVGINPLVMIAAPDHPWTRAPSIGFDLIARTGFVVREQGSGTRLWTEEWLQRFGVELRPELELGSNEAIKQAVRGGHGLAVISLHAVQLELEAGELVMLDVPYFPAPVYWHLVQKPDRRLTPAAEAFHNHLLAEMPRLDQQLVQRLHDNDQPWPPTDHQA